MRKILFWAIPLCMSFLICVSYLPIIVGSIAQVVLRFQGWDVKYSNIVWKDQSLILTDIDAKHATTFIHVPILEIDIFHHHIRLTRPYIQISEIPVGFPVVSFSLQKGESIVAKITMDEGWVDVEKNERLVVKCHHFPMSYLNLEGVIDGTFEIKEEVANWEATYGSMRCLGYGLSKENFEAEIRYDEATVSFKCNDADWEIRFNDVQADFASTLLKIAEKFDFPSWKMEEGKMSGAVSSLSGNLKILNLQTTNLHLRKEHTRFVCEQFKIVENVYSFVGGSFFVDDEPIGTDWQGSGEVSKEGTISGKLGPFQMSADFIGTLDQISGIMNWCGPFCGEGKLNCERNQDGWNFVFQVGKGEVIEELQLHGELREEDFSLYDVKGILNLGKKVAFYCPILEKNGRFDVRFVHPLFDLVRLNGSCHSGKIVFDQFSHFLGSKLIHGSANLSEKEIDFECRIPWKLLTFFIEVPEIYKENDEIACKIAYHPENAKIHLQSSILYEENEIPIDLELLKVGSEIQFASNIWGGHVTGSCFIDPEGLFITDGKVDCQKAIQCDFSGKVTTFEQGELNLSHLEVELGIFKKELQGRLKGEGILHWKGALEADFDLSGERFQFHAMQFINSGSLHIFCSSSMGIVIQGLNLAYEDANCKIGLLQYKFCDDQPVFSLTETQFHMPTDLLARCGFENFAAMHGTADFSFSSDLSKVFISMKEAILPYEDEQFLIRNLHAVINQNEWSANFDLDHHSRLIPIDVTATCIANILPAVIQRSGDELGSMSRQSQNRFLNHERYKGRLTIENGLKLDWVYKDRFSVQSIEGKCSGVEASFHLDGETLVGSAQVDGNEIRYMLPEKIAKVFDELKIGSGYELMGRLNFQKGLGFKGILSGKQIELFGFELKNLLSQIEWDKDHLLIQDLKISDFAGVLKVEKVLAEGKENDPWTLSIPHIVITELRPSLLQDVGGPPGKLSPLVVREIKINDFFGFVDDSKSYTAKGELFFINSYKRENSILELPSDILSRIVGLDVELLTPVCGTLKYELQDGFFHFTELTNSYSENKRSEFFLVFDEDSPKMDLDWNLNIFIQTKQFVLFKFTERFLISVTGKLDAPKFQLQRKKHFLGVL
jgi:hypothetical protein